MPRKEGQKRKLLALLDILIRETDEEHPLSVPRLVEMLAARGIEAERKSIYADIEALNDLPGQPFDIVQQRGRGGGYYMAGSVFELAELKLLVDAVYASRFITARKSRTLIDKLGRFTSRYHEEALDRKVLVSGRLKSRDEKILYTVDALHAAITAGVQVRFTYCDWDLEKHMTPRHGGREYRVSPWVLVWEGNYYYLIAYTNGGLRHYRVDKIAQVRPLPDTVREGKAEYEAFDVDAYMQQVFGMFNGPLRRVTLKCRSEFVGAILDRFGTALTLVPITGEDAFTITPPVQVSPQFFGWVAGFGGGVEILAPADVRAGMAQTLAAQAALYR